MESKKLKQTDVLDFINEIEGKFNVEEWVLDNIHIWPILRIRLAYQLDDMVKTRVSVTKKQLFERAIHKSLSMPNGLLRHYYAKTVDCRNNDRLDRKIDVVFFTYASSRSFRVREAWVDRFSDPFIYLFKQRKLESLSLERSSRYEYKIPRFNRSILIQPGLSWLALLNTIKCKNLTFPSSTQAELYQFFDYLGENVLDAYIPDLYSTKLRVGYIRLVADYLKRILKKADPLLLFGSNYYGDDDMAAILACRELGITSVDIQHGIQGDYHIAYARWTKVPEGGYELMPNVFWNWSEDEHRTIQAWNQDVREHHRSIVGGNLLYQVFGDKDNEISKYYDETFRHLVPERDKYVHLLLSLQWGVGLLDLYRDAMNRSPSNFYWWVRGHPSMSRREIKEVIAKLRELKNVNFNFEEATSFPLFTLLKYMDVNITENSTTIIEAEWFGVPSIITNESGARSFEKQLESGVAITAYTVSDLLQAIDYQAGKKEQFKNEGVVFAALDKGSGALDELISYARRRKEASQHCDSLP